MMRAGLRLLLFATATLGAACSGSPLAPARPGIAPASASAAVTVSAAIGTVDGPPLADVTVWVDEHAAAVTTSTGRVTFAVPTGRDVKIGVTHATRRPFVPSATSTFQPGAHEEWAFAFVP